MQPAARVSHSLSPPSKGSDLVKRLSLKSRSGCLRCRQRRKKCDESRPICSFCERYGAKCEWLDAHAVPLHARRRAVSRISVDTTPPASSIGEAVDCIRPATRPSCLVWACPSPNSSLSASESPWIEALFSHFVSQMIPRFNLAETLPEFRDHSHLLLMARLHPELHTALIACSGADLSALIPEFHHVAVKNYALAIRALNYTISVPRPLKVDDWLIYTALLLAEFEKVRKDVPGDPTPHIMGTFALFKRRWQQALSGPAAGTSGILERVGAETIVYNLPMLYFHGKGSAIEVDRKIDWAMMDQYFHISPWSTLLNHSPVLNPAMGIPYPFFKVVVQTCRLLCQADPLDSEDLHTLSKLREDARQADQVLGEWTATATDDMSDGLTRKSLITATSKQGDILHILCTRILLEGRLATQPGDRICLELLLSRAFAVAESTDMAVPYAEYFVWPLLVLQREARSDVQSQLVQTKLQEIVQQGYSWVRRWDQFGSQTTI